MIQEDSTRSGNVHNDEAKCGLQAMEGVSRLDRLNLIYGDKLLYSDIKQQHTPTVGQDLLRVNVYVHY